MLPNGVLRLLLCPFTIKELHLLALLTVRQYATPFVSHIVSLTLSTHLYGSLVQFILIQQELPPTS